MPERFHGKCDRRSDVYGLGLTLYEMVALRPPYEAADRHVLMQRVLNDRPAWLKSIAPTVPRDLETIIEKAIVRDPAQRYLTAAAVADDLQRFLEDRPSQARRTSRTERLVRWCRRNPGLATLMSAVALLLLLVTAVSSTAAIRLNRERDRTRAVYLENRRTLYAAQIHLAHSAWDDAQVPRAEEILAGPPCVPVGPDDPELRGWEWRYLQRLCQSEALTLTDSETNLFCVAFSPDGRWLAAGGWDGRVRLWDLASEGPECRVLSGHGKEVHQVTFSPDSRTLASAGSDYRVRFWNVETGRESGSLTAADTTRSVVFSPDGSRIATAGVDRMIDIWDATDRRHLATFPAHDAQILCLAYSPDGSKIASCGQDKKAKLWDVESRRLLQTFAGHISQVSSVAFQRRWRYPGHQQRRRDNSPLGRPDRCDAGRAHGSWHVGLQRGLQPQRPAPCIGWRR